MNEYLVADRYARALAGAVPDDSALESIQEDINALATLLHENGELRSLMNSPAIPMAVRHGAFEKILETAVNDDTTRRFAATLLKRGRIGLLPRVVDRFAELVDVRLNRVTAMVTSAVPLDAAQAENIQKGLAEYCGKTVRIEAHVDPDIIGGVLVRVGGKILDGSLRARLAQLKESLLAEET